MNIHFNADEIFQMAEQMERNGAKFYRRVAEGAADPQPRQLLLDLAVMEDDHEKIFAAMRTGLSHREREGIVFNPEDETASYLRAIANEHVFDVKADPAEFLTGQETMEEVIQTAIGLEKDSIVFYLGIKDMVPEKLGKIRIENIIEEEMGHIASLSEALASLNQ